MRRSIRSFAALVAVALAGAVPGCLGADAAPATPITLPCAAPGADTETGTPPPDATASAADAAALAAIQHLPLDELPAQVSRGENAERGELTLTLPEPLAGIGLTTEVTSGAAGPIGQVTEEDGELVFAFHEITYDVAPVALPNGRTIAAQTIRLDPAQPSELCVDLATGRLTRNFHWLLTGTNVAYDGDPTLALGDRGRATVAAVDELDRYRYTIRILTHWQSEIDLSYWSVDGETLPSGRIEASAEFDGTYLLDFRK